MQKILKFAWPISFLFVVLAVTITSYYDERYAFDLIRSFLNGETAIGFWMKHGLSLRQAVAMVTICSTYDLFTWFYLFGFIKGVHGRVESWRSGFFRNNIAVAKEKSRSASKFLSLAEKVYLFCVPHPEKICEHGPEKNAVGNPRYYLPLVFYGYCPAYIWTGIGYSMSFRLNTVAAFIVLAAANAMKMITAGYLTIRIGVWGVFAIIITMPFTKWGIEKLLKNLQKKQTAAQ